MKLDKVVSVRKSGHEAFHFDGKRLNQNLLSFWQWSSSEILGNSLRGVLAEYIVSLDIKSQSIVREEWDIYDLVTPEGWKVEVKSASYIQSWKQERFSKISFGIQPTIMWEEDNQRSKEAKRHADIYVFCLLSHKEQDSIDPLNLSQWQFYILSSKTLNEKLGNQKSITLSSLTQLSPEQCRYGEIHQKIKHILRADKEYK